MKATDALGRVNQELHDRLTIIVRLAVQRLYDADRFDEHLTPEERAARAGRDIGRACRLSPEVRDNVAAIFESEHNSRLREIAANAYAEEVAR